MGRHGKDPPKWTIVMGLVSAGLAIAAFVALLVLDPGKPATCRYSSNKVTIEITGPDCVPIMQMVTDSADDGHVWRKADKPSGQIYAQLQKDQDTVRLYENGDKPFAMVISGFFQARKWIVVAPSATP